MKKEKCAFKNCKKKIKLTDMPCHCSFKFCSRHRLPEMHECSWDPKSKEEREKYIKKAGLDEAILFQKLQTI